MPGFEGRSITDPSFGYGNGPWQLDIFFLILVGFGIYKFWSLNRYENDYIGWLGVIYFLVVLPIAIMIGKIYGIIIFCIIIANYLYIASKDKEQPSTKPLNSSQNKNTTFEKRQYNLKQKNLILENKKDQIATILGEYIAVLRRKKEPKDFRFCSLIQAQSYRSQLSPSSKKKFKDNSLNILLKKNENLDDWELRYLKLDLNYEQYIKELNLKFDDLYDPSKLSIKLYSNLNYLLQEESKGNISREEIGRLIYERRNIFGSLKI